MLDAWERFVLYYEIILFGLCCVHCKDRTLVHSAFTDVHGFVKSKTYILNAHAAFFLIRTIFIYLIFSFTFAASRIPFV